MSWTSDVGAVLAFGATSGAVAGIVNQAAGAFRDRRDRNFRQGERKAEQRFTGQQQEAERVHQATLRAEAAHAAARQEFIGIAADVAGWIQGEFADAYGADGDYFGGNQSPSELTTPRRALIALRKIAWRHPTREVRLIAAKLVDTVDDQYFTSEMAQAGPSQMTFQSWVEQSETLIDVILQPPPMPARGD